MAIQKKVFGSPDERKNFKSLESKWSKQVRIYHNLPYRNIINTEDIPLRDSDERQLFKTSVDYTLCDENDRPLLSIELDGVSYGFNVGKRYIAEFGAEQSRHYMMGLKLRAATESSYPFFVVSPAEFEPLAPDLAWPIVDGVVGSVLANRRLKELCRNFTCESLGMSQEEFDDLSEPDRDELIQDWALSAETDCELEFNPLSKLKAKLECDLGPVKTSYWYKTEPDTDAITDPLERAEAFLKVVRWICEYSVEHRTLGSVTGKASVPNFDGIGVLSEFVATDCSHHRARLIAVTKGTTTVIGKSGGFVQTTQPAMPL
jgi:hypothetical protein